MPAETCVGVYRVRYRYYLGLVAGMRLGEPKGVSLQHLQWKLLRTAVALVIAGLQLQPQWKEICFHSRFIAI